MASGLADPLTDETVIAALKRAQELGLNGFGGHCGHAAAAINDVLFAGKGEIVGAFNTEFLKHGDRIGHIAVRVGTTYWDADGTAKEVDDITSWGMLDPEDPDYQEQAEDHGFVLDDTKAESVSLVAMTTSEACRAFGFGEIARITAAAILTRALRDV